MFIRNILFTILAAALQLCNPAFGDDWIDVDGVLGGSVTFNMPSPTNVDRCTVESNTGVVFSLVPNEGTRPTGVSQGFNAQLHRLCTMTISPVTNDHIGRWIIHASVGVPGEDDDSGQTNHNVTVGHFRLGVAQRVDVFPSGVTSIYRGNTVTLRLLNHYENLTKCIATSPDGEKFDVLNAESNEMENVKPFDQCGIILHASDDVTSGNWRLDAWIGEYVNLYGSFSLQVLDFNAISSENLQQRTVTHVQSGSSVRITPGSRDATSCQLRNPSGQTLPLRSGNCRADIESVTDVHHGLWTATYTLTGKVNPVEEIFEVVVYEDRLLNTSVTTSSQGEVNLLCRVRGFSFTFCRFVSPDERVLNIYDGIGDERYRYYGQGSQSASLLTQRDHECGITILKPQYSDYGAWKCIVGTSSVVTGSILQVPAPDSQTYDRVHALYYGENVYAVKGRSFTVRCAANAKLEYCWVRSPNGTSYSVSSTGNSAGTLRYSGMGLSLGECGAIIPASQETDTGGWLCSMGVAEHGRKELATNVWVVVSDTMLTTYSGVMTMGTRRTELSCYLPPVYEQSMEYCRWIHPNGDGIRSGTSHLYSVRRTINSCLLAIEEPRIPLDLGNWTCVAGLRGSSEEVWATIRLQAEPQRNDSGNKNWSLIVGLATGIISIVIAVIVIAVIRAKLRSKEKSGLPPRYDENNVNLPPTTIPYRTC